MRPVRTGFTVNLHLVVDTVPKMLEAIDALEGREILVGVAEETTDRKAEAGDPPGMTNAAIAHIQNDGSPAQNIPGGHFMEQGIEDVQDRLADGMQLAAQEAVAGDRTAVEKRFTQVGLVAVSGIRNKITSGPWPALKPGTLRARRARGRLGTNRYIDSGQMRNAMTSIIR